MILLILTSRLSCLRLVESYRDTRRSMTSFGGLREVLDNQSTERVMQENPELVPSSSGRDGAGTSTATVNNSELPVSSFAFKAVGDCPPHEIVQLASTMIVSRPGRTLYRARKKSGEKQKKSPVNQQCAR